MELRIYFIVQVVGGGVPSVSLCCIMYVVHEYEKLVLGYIVIQ